MARPFGILTTVSGLSGTMVINSFTTSGSVEVAEARNESGKVTDRKAYSKTTTYRGDGLLDTNEVPAEAVSAGATIVIEGKTCLIESCDVTETNNEFAKVSFTATHKDDETVVGLTGGTAS